MKVVTADEIRKIDSSAIKDIGIPSLVLMERAGVSAAEHICKRYSPHCFSGISRALVLCGGGNNGGDGFVIARELLNRSFDVKVILLADLKDLSSDCEKQYNIAKNFGLDIIIKPPLDDFDLSYGLIIDAVFGTGLNKPIKGYIAQVFERIKTFKDIISVDIPSGICSDTGQILGSALIAKLTITFGLPKIGLLLFPGREHCGELIIENIGFPKRLLEERDIKCELIERDWIRTIIPKRTLDSNKGDYGHVLIIGGARGKVGALIMSAQASMRTGCGRVTIGVPESLSDVYQIRVVEEMVLTLKDKKGGFSKSCISQIYDFINGSVDVIAIGPGMGVNDESLEIVSSLIKSSPLPLVIDADALNCISSLRYEDRIKLLNSSKMPIILTPHTGEMSRLLTKDRGMGSSLLEKNDFRELCREIEADRLNIARAFSKESGAVLVLKGASTVIAAPDGNTYINITGNCGMASAGSGDVLTGMIASFLGQGTSPIEAAQIGVYLHGLSGDIGAKIKSAHSLTASNIINNISSAINEVLG